MLNKIKKFVMAFTSGQLANNTINEVTNNPISGDELSPQELEYLLGVLKNADLKGYQVETFYTLVIKLQNQFIKKSK